MGCCVTSYLDVGGSLCSCCWAHAYLPGGNPMRTRTRFGRRVDYERDRSRGHAMMSWLHWESFALGATTLLAVSATVLAAALWILRARERRGAAPPLEQPEPWAGEGEAFGESDRFDAAGRELVGFDPRLN